MHAKAKARDLIIIDRIALAKQGDNVLGRVGPSVRLSVRPSVHPSVTALTAEGQSHISGAQR